VVIVPYFNLQGPVGIEPEPGTVGI
jgi:hypothetical protein